MTASSLEISGLEKSFGGVKALRGASLTCFGGETHALIGENGAGKSTLVKVLSGSVKPDHGEIILNGERRSRLHLRSKHAKRVSRRRSRSSA